MHNLQLVMLTAVQRVVFTQKRPTTGYQCCYLLLAQLHRASYCRLVKATAAIKVDVAALAFPGSALTAWASNLNLERVSCDHTVRLKLENGFSYCLILHTNGGTAHCALSFISSLPSALASSSLSTLIDAQLTNYTVAQFRGSWAFAVHLVCRLTCRCR